jgi:hypothetical protein
MCLQVEGLLTVENVIAAQEEPGPDTELEYWRNRMARFNSLTEQLKSKGCRVVLGVTGMMRSQVRVLAGEASQLVGLQMQQRCLQCTQVPGSKCAASAVQCGCGLLTAGRRSLCG